MKLKLPVTFRHQSQGIRTKTRPYVSSCPWRLTYNIQGHHISEVAEAVSVEIAALLIGKGIPIAAEFDDAGTGNWCAVVPIALSKLWDNPVLARKERELEAQEDGDV